MLLAEGVSKIKVSQNITDHTKSCFYIYESFVPGFEPKVTKCEEDSCVMIEIKGNLINASFL